MGEKLGELIGLAVVLFAFGGWVQHVVTCIGEDRWGFLIAGALFFPIAVFHGWGIWFGWWH